MSVWPGFALSGQRRWRCQGRARIWQVTQDQILWLADRRVADFVDELRHTTVLPSWMRLVEVDWNASSRRLQRHNQQHDPVDCQWHPVNRTRRSGCRQHTNVDTVQRTPPTVLDPLYIEERVTARGPTLVGLHIAPVVESTWIQDRGRIGTECGWRGMKWSTYGRCRWNRMKSSVGGVRSGGQQYQMRQTSRVALHRQVAAVGGSQYVWQDFEDRRLCWVLSPISGLEVRQQLVNTVMIEHDQELLHWSRPASAVLQ